MKGVEYQLNTLGPHEFENMVRALCLVEMGPGLTVFGGGPDGGREASYRGSLSMTTEEQWSGHTVVQAKYRREERDPADNLRWLLRQIKGELNQWGKPDSKRVSNGVRPDNLIIVSNVSLSSAAGGGIDTAAAEMKNIADQEGVILKNWRIWPAQQVKGMLDTATDVRRAYGGFLTPGDVLAQFVERLDPDDEDLERALSTYVVKEMLGEQWVALDAAGGGSREDRVQLGHVAVDLPLLHRDTREFGWAMQALVAHADTVPRYDAAAAALPPHVLLVGGPGQGKSTITGLLAQVYRVALLRKSTTLRGEARRLHADLVEVLPERGLPLPVNCRWPIRIDLAAYAEAIAGEMEPSLLKYLAKRVSARSSVDVTAAKLDQWLGRYPWLLILDGLDEVASPSVRDSVVRSMTEFLVDAGSRHADVVVVATTRPQGYANELDGRDYTRLELRELTPEQAVKYSDGLAEARLPNDDDLRNHIHAAMVDAAQEPITARLLRTPLQVSIMSRLLEKRERIPQERHALFDAYFSTIYFREANKKGHIAKLLEDRRNDVVWVHQRVGLTCHVGSESGTDASIPRQQLHQIALDRLRGEGLEASEAERIAEQIATAAIDRLVLIVPQGEGDNVGFEVRSLQEYMAARALTAGSDEAIVQRLRPLIPAAHWRNTWLFAAGFIFSERETLRNNIVGLLRESEGGNALYKLAGVGADLAGDLVYDGLASKAITLNRTLVYHAIEGIDGPPGRNWRKLDRVLQQAADDSQSRSAMFQAIDASFARGGGPRATALLLCKEWEASTGELTAGARQRLTNKPVNDFVPGAALVLRMICADPPAGWPSVGGYFSGFQTDDTAVAAVIVDLLTDRRPDRSPLKSLSADVAEIDSGGAWVVDRIPDNPDHFERPLMDDTSLQVTPAAEALCRLIDAIPPQDWHVAHTVRAALQTWLSRRSVGSGLLDA